MANNKKIARHVIARHTTHNVNKTDSKLSGKIASIGSERDYRQCYLNFLRWCDDNGIHPNFRANLSTLKQYLDERREWVQQKALNQERQALQIVFKQKLPHFKSLQKSVYDKRSYTLQEVNAIIYHQNEKNSITSWLSFFCGMRAHESATISPATERNSSTHRNWDPLRFTGLHHYRLYTVIGKGGLVREVAVPLWLSNRLEARRISPIKVVDREIIYFSYYDIGFGQAWSQSFTSASKRALGFSRGAHGLRHSFAKWRLQVLIEKLEKNPRQPSPEEHALLILSQELGHFRLDIVYTYLR